MSSANETVAEIVKRVRRECNSYPLPANAAEMLRLVREIEAAHNREMNELAGQKSDEAKEAFMKNAELADAILAKDAEIAELRKCLKEAIREMCPFTRMSCKHGEQCDYVCGTEKWRKALAGVNHEN